MPELKWIADGDLTKATDKFVSSIADCRAKHQQRMIRNVLDPFSIAAIAHVFRLSNRDDVMGVAGSSAIVNCIGNALGEFHQEILGSAKGWQNHDRGFDVISEEHQKLAEIKNKHNTMNAANRREVEEGLKQTIRQRERGWIAYLVLIIPKQPIRYERNLNDAGTVLETDGASFYAMVSGEQNALHDVLDHLCKALNLNSRVTNWIGSLSSLPPRL